MDRLTQEIAAPSPGFASPNGRGASVHLLTEAKERDRQRTSNAKRVVEIQSARRRKRTGSRPLKPLLGPRELSNGMYVLDEAGPEFQERLEALRRDRRGRRPKRISSKGRM